MSPVALHYRIRFRRPFLLGVLHHPGRWHPRRLTAPPTNRLLRRAGLPPQQLFLSPRIPTPNSSPETSNPNPKGSLEFARAVEEGLARGGEGGQSSPEREKADGEQGEKNR